MTDERKLNLSEGLVIAGLPVAGYWFAYLYELGYCHFVGVPAFYIEISLLNVLAAVVGILSLAAIAYPIMEILKGICPDSFPVPIKSALKRIGFGLSLSVGFAIVNKVSGRGLFWIVGIFVLLLFFELLFPLLTQRKTPGYIAKLEAQRRYDLEYDTVMDVLVKKIDRGAVAILFYVFVASFFVYFAGGYMARTQKEYTILIGSPERVVLKKIDSGFLVAELFRAERKYVSTFSLVDQQTPGIQFKFEPVGPLRAKQVSGD